MGYIDLVGSSYQLSQTNQSSQRVINWYVVRVREENEGAKSKYMLCPTPGANRIAAVTASKEDICRGLYYSTSGTAPTYEGRIYGVFGSGVYRFDRSNTYSYKIGEISASSNQVSMTDNGMGGYFVIVDGYKMYRYPLDAEDTSGKILEEVELPYVPGQSINKISPTHIAFLAQRLIVNTNYGNQFFYTKLGSTEFDLESNADWYSAESSADPINAVKSLANAAWIFGTRSFEIWRSTDNDKDPFSYTGGSSSMIGCKAPKSVATINDIVFWLGGSDVGSDAVFMGRGTTAERVSTTAIEDQILSLEDRSEAIGWAYVNKGNLFYVISFPSSDRTFVYEKNTNKWHERLGRNQSTGKWKCYPYVYGIFAGDKIYCGTLDSSDIVYLNENKFTEYNSNQIVREFISPVFSDSSNNIIVKECVLDCQVGTTEILNGQGSDPKIIMQISRDGGYTYGSFKSKSLGKQGNYRKIVRWNALGISRQFVFKLIVSEPIPVSIYQMRIDAETCGRT